jgi:hypothetical protein
MTQTAASVLDHYIKRIFEAEVGIQPPKTTDVGKLQSSFD